MNQSVVGGRDQTKRSISSGVDHGADTRDVDAGLWLCTDASEPQYTSHKHANR